MSCGSSLLSLRLHWRTLVMGRLPTCTARAGLGKGPKSEEELGSNPVTGLTRKSTVFSVKMMMSCNKSGWVGWGKRRLERIEPK